MIVCWKNRKENVVGECELIAYLNKEKKSKYCNVMLARDRVSTAAHFPSTCIEIIFVGCWLYFFKNPVQENLEGYKVPVDHYRWLEMISTFTHI